MAPSRPTVVLTRAAEDNIGLAEPLRAAGLDVLEAPTAAVVHVPIEPDAEAVQAWLARAHAVTFASRHGVRSVVSQLGAEVLRRPGLLIAAVGQGTAAELRAVGLDVAVTSAEPATAAGLAKALQQALLPRRCVVVVQGRWARPELVDRLLVQGHDARVATVYENRVPDPPPLPAERLSDPATWVFAAAPSAVARMVGWYPLTAHWRWIAIGPSTAEALMNQGIVPAALCPAADPATILETLLAAVAAVPPGAPMTYDRRLSDAWYDRAVEAIPGGVHSPVRAFKSVGGRPVYFACASGVAVTDVDGNDYIDFCLSWGPLILGHADPQVVQAVQQAAPLGLTYGACHPGEVTVAETLVACFPGMEMARLTSSGTEAVMTAIRLARGATQRSLIVKFEGGYHGHFDSLLVKAGSGLVTLADPGGEASSAGVPRELAHLTVTLPFDDLDAARQLFAQHGARIAAVILEPLPANNGLLVQTPQFLQGLRTLCTEHGALLVFDEVISGFRVHNGGYGELAGVQPDLVTLGKIIGGGLPMGAVLGPARIMTLLAPLGPVYQAGTLSGNPLSIAAGLETLCKLAAPGFYRQLEQLGAYLEHRLQQTGIAWLRGQRVGSIWWPYFDEGPLPRRADQISAVAVQRFNAMYHHVLRSGIYLPPSAYEVLFLSAAHSEAHIDRLVDALAGAAREIL